MADRSLGYTALRRPLPIVNMAPIVLASTSPYRRELLQRLRVTFSVQAPDIDERPLAGELPRDDALRRDALTPQARGALQRMRANVLLQRLAARLSAPPEAANAPSLAIVLMGPMLWSRFEALDGEVQVQVHVAGPEPGDLVLVTDTPGLEAIAAGGMDFARAAELGVLRLYGPAAQLDLLQLRLTPGIPK